ncbi:MAG: hypothetical protein AVDCRST_MAG59-3186, partial [uncultured Thermomicrobiales bacterium]
GGVPSRRGRPGRGQRRRRRQPPGIHPEVRLSLRPAGRRGAGGRPRLRCPEAGRHRHPAHRRRRRQGRPSRLPPAGGATAGRDPGGDEGGRGRERGGV